MRMLRKPLLVCLIAGLAGPALAEREVHVVAIGAGYQAEDYYALPEARLLVDRPDQEVGLVLLDNGDVHWKVDATPGTIISDIIRGGADAGDSQITLYGIPMTGVQVSGLPMVFRPEGRDFRALVDALAEKMDISRLSSFHGVHRATKTPMRVDSVDTQTAGLARDYLLQQLGSTDDLPPSIRDWTETGEDTAFTLVFDEIGITLTGPTGTRHFAAGPEVPETLLPSAAVYDPGSQMIYCITYGAEGYLYSVNAQTGAWAVVTSLEEYDASGLLYVPESHLLITTGAFSRPGEIKVFGFDGEHTSIFIPTTAFPGLTDLFDYGNEHGPPLTPRAYSEGWLLLEAVARRDTIYPGTPERRLYAVRIASGDVRLLDYGRDGE